MYGDHCNTIYLDYRERKFFYDMHVPYIDSVIFVIQYYLHYIDGPGNGFDLEKKRCYKNCK